MKALITGGYGFAGRHLAEHLVKCGDTVVVTYRETATGEPEEEEYAIALPRTTQAVALDVTNAAAVRQLLTVLQPDVVYHLAGMTFVPEADKHPERALEVNHQGSINVLEGVKNACPEARVLLVTSSEVYGEPVPGSLPLTEQSVLQPATHYGLSKAAADLTGFTYARRHNLHVVRVRPFPHLGPGQSDRFALSSFARQIAEIKLGTREPIIRVGNLEARRDYSDVSDIVRGYREAALNGKRGAAYNLCSGKSEEIGELLQLLIKVAEVEVEVQEDPDRVRPVDIADMYGSHDLATRHFGWKPRVTIEGTLSSLFAFWIEALSK